jgi:hypothetical protein
MMGDIQDMYGKITDERGFLRNLISKIPGFKGYMEKAGRREADQLLRDTISSRMEQSRLDLAAVQQALSRDIIAAIDFAEPIGRADNQLMGLIGKIKDAPQGYAGFFDPIKVEEEDLERIYNFDNQMLDHAAQIDADIAALNKAVTEGANIEAAIDQLNQDLKLANELFNSRQEVISEVSITSEK